jgi:hypothetical protein
VELEIGSLIPMEERRTISRPPAIRGRWVLVCGVLVLAGVAYLAFELGRVRGGYSFIDAAELRAGLVDEIQTLQSDNEGLRRKVAVLETARGVDREAYDQVEANLDDLQARIQAQEEALAFYRGIVAPEDGAAGLRVQALELFPVDLEASVRFRLHLVLVQAVKHDRRVSGVVNLIVAGERDGASISYPLSELTSDEAFEKLVFSFRYFQDFQTELTLPDNFRPRQVEVELRPSGRGAKPVDRVFDWAVTPS